MFAVLLSLIAFFLACTRINGIPACANKKLLTDILRGEWGFQGYVVSDEGAVELLWLGHNYTHSLLESAIGEHYPALTSGSQPRVGSSP